MLISVHIPKCGGITFEHVLRRMFGRRRLWLYYGADPSRDDSRPDRQIPAGTVCIHGHFPSDAFDEFVPQPDLVTWLRHPVERVVSNYHHFFRHPDPANPCCRVLLERRLSLEEFAELEPMRNEASRYLAGKPLTAFRFVGITERFSESLEAFGAAFGVATPAEPRRENANPARTTECYPISPQTHARIAALNHSDLIAYEAAAALLDRRAASARPKVA